MKVTGLLKSMAVAGVALASAMAVVLSDTDAKCTLKCESDEVCKLEQVVCITAPCPPIETCVPVSKPKPMGCDVKTPDSAGELKCSKKCGESEVCMTNDDGSEYCYNPCIAALCPIGTVCELSSELPQCLEEPCPPAVVCNPIQDAD